jgi:hypothetical protein
MSKIKLLHSYLYIDNTKNLSIKNNKIYDLNNNFICGLSNIPKQSEGIKIILEKNLVKNRQSKKIVNTYYEKNNIKVFIEYDVKTANLVKNKVHLIKMLKNNYLNFVDINKNLFDCVCINKNYNRELFKKYDILMNKQNIIKIFNWYVDLSKNSIKKIKSCKEKVININFNILYSDYILGTIKIINDYDLTNSIIICNNNSTKLLWKTNLNASNFIQVVTLLEFNKITKNVFYNNIILCDIENKELSKMQGSRILCIYTDIEKESIKSFLTKFYNIVNIKNKILINFNITIQTLYNYSKCIIYHSFYDKLVESNNIKKIKLKDTYKINPLIKLIRFNFIKEDTIIKKTRCSICLETCSENDFVYLNCNHKFCKDCISKLHEYKSSCSICRGKILNFNKTVYFKSIFDKKNWYYVGNGLNKIIDKINESDNYSLIYLEKMDLYPLLNTILCNYVSKKFKFILNLKTVVNNLNKDNSVNLFYLQNKKEMDNSCNYLCLIIKNYYKTINLFEFDISNY